MDAVDLADLRADFNSLLTSGRCTVYGLTYNSQKGLDEPSTTPLKQHVPCSIMSVSSIRDPNITSIVQSLNISYEQYRRIEIPYGTVSIKQDYRLVKEPVKTTSDTYQVVEAVQPDETTPLSLILHCRKL